MKEDIDGTLECLQMLEKQYADVKTFYDILLYQTKDGWKCAIDVALDVSELDFSVIKNAENFSAANSFYDFLFAGRS